MKWEVSFSIRALAPISHGAFTDGKDTGNMMEFRQMELIGVDGSICQIPVISGNALRGSIRRFLTREYMEKLGWMDDRLYFLMANGGALSKSLDGYIRPERVARVRTLFPILSAFGSAMYSYMLPGQVNVAFAALRCEEIGTGQVPSADLLTEIGLTRHLDRTICNYGEGEKPMPFTVEAVMAGSVFDCHLSFLESATELDRATVMHGLNKISTIGGKHAAGFGEVELSQVFDDAPYLEWLTAIDDAYRDTVQEWLKELVCSIK